MARTRLNPRQRRGIAYLAVAAVGCLGVYTAVSSYVNDVRAEIGPLVPAVQLVADVQAYDTIPAEAIEIVGIPARWLPATAVPEPANAEGLVASTDLQAGSLLQTDMLTEPPEVGPGERAVTLALDTADIAPDVARGDRVDVIAAYDGSGNGVDETPPSTEVVVEGGVVVERQPVEGDSENREQLTFALPAGDALRLGFAQSYASRVTVVAVGPESPPLTAGEESYTNDGGERP